jgi:dinuclear metal center YbgI/SA1388 family protein
MPSSVAEVMTVVEKLWPISGAEEWDAAGLLSGSPTSEVARIHLAVDAVQATADEAVELNADLLLVHHPLLFRGVTSVAEDGYKGAVLSRLIRANCALISAHTNADVVESGTSAVFAEKLGLTGVRPIVPASSSVAKEANVSNGIGRVGSLAEPTTLGWLARLLGEILPATASGIRVAGDFDASVQIVAVCAGAGDGYLAEPEVLAADVYITSDLRHHPASEASENARISGGPALIDVSHWASEWLWLETAAEQLRAALPEVTVTVSDLRTDPWDFVVMQ